MEGEGFYLQRIDGASEAAPKFTKLVTNYISRDYDEITRSFAENLLAVGGSSGDPYGYFTLGKEVWVAIDNTTDDCLGFEVVTRKRGGSIKIGPTIVLPEARGRGISHQMINRLFDLYADYGVRKAYVTAPLRHHETAGLDFRYLNFRLEAVLKSHYRQDSLERVAGRFFFASNAIPVRSKVVLDRASHGDYEVVINESSVPQEELSDFMAGHLAIAYDDIDSTFFDALFASNDIELDYPSKPKVIWECFHAGVRVAVVVGALKRGGTVKIAPFVIADGHRNVRCLDRIFEAIHKRATQIGRHKVMYLLPFSDWGLISYSLERGGSFEGVLREPYKPGVDVAVVSFFM